MRMSGRQKRLLVILVGLTALASAAALILTALEENIVFFHSPSALVAMSSPPRDAIRVGGLVKTDSVQRKGEVIDFTITDLTHEIAVRYKGVVPDLFREGQGVIAEGTIQKDGRFLASVILAKHDENYMPPAVAESLNYGGNK